MCKNTQVLKADNPADILTAIELLRRGEIVAIPTETVYGLAGDAKNEAALHKIFVAKNRPTHHPLIVHVSSLAAIEHWGQELPASLENLATAFWPGSLTVLLKKAPWVSPIVTGGLDTIGIRIPNNPVVLKILDHLGTGLAAPSANPHKKISPTTANHVISGLNGKISAVLDGGACQVGLESTILDLTQANPRILRAGPITQRQLERVLKSKIDNPMTHVTRVAGNMKEHYQPQTPARLLNIKHIQHYLDSPTSYTKKIGVLHYTHLEKQAEPHFYLRMPTNKDAYARCLYHNLHHIDTLSLDQVVIELPPALPDWDDVHDRLSKATASGT